MNKVLSYVLVRYLSPELQLPQGEESAIIKRLARLAKPDETALIILAPPEEEIPSTWLEMRGQDVAEIVGSLGARVLDYVYEGQHRRVLFYHTAQLLRLPDHPLFTFDHRQVIVTTPIEPFPAFPIKVVYMTTYKEIGKESEMGARNVVRGWLEDHSVGYEGALYYILVEQEGKKQRECTNAVERYLTAGGINQTDHLFYEDLEIRIWRAGGGALATPTIAETTVNAMSELVNGKIIWFSTYETEGSIFGHTMRPTTSNVKKLNKYTYKGAPEDKDSEFKWTPWSGEPKLGPDVDSTPETEFDSNYDLAVKKGECFEDKVTKKLYYRLVPWIPGVIYFFPVKKPVCPEFITVSHDIAESKFEPVEKKETK